MHASMKTHIHEQHKLQQHVDVELLLEKRADVFGHFEQAPQHAVHEFDAAMRRAASACVLLY